MKGQPTLFEPIPSTVSLPSSQAPRRVRETSIAQYEAAAEFKGRRGMVARWLESYWDNHENHPTSAELADYGVEDMGAYDDLPMNHFSEVVLYVRRGLSDLQRTGTVESPGKRVCRLTQNLCRTWRVKSR